jgi:CRISPR/Cas system endoribonuclease Cas6 (RAMP superfamily)
MFVIIIYFLAIGHKNAKNKKNDQKRKIEQNNVVEASNEATTKAFISSLFALSRSTMWYVDFGVSMHLFHEWKWFRDYETISPINIYMGDNFTQEAIKRGNIKALC